MPERASLSAPTSPVGRRTRTAGHEHDGLRPPVGRQPAEARLPPLQAPTTHDPGSGVGEAVTTRQPGSPGHISDAQGSTVREPHPAAQCAPSTQQPPRWLPAGVSPVAAGPHAMLDAAAERWTLPPLAVEPLSLPSSPIAAGASPVCTGAAAVGVDVTAALTGGNATEERDVSAEFDVAVLIGDLNYRCASRHRYGLPDGVTCAYI